MDRVGQVAYIIAAIAGGAVLSYYGPQSPRAVLAVFVGATAIWSLSFVRRWHERRQAAISPALALGPNAPAPLNRPNIKPVRVFTDARSMIAVGASTPHTYIHCAHVVFKNEPTPGSHPDAQVSDVLAEIKFFRQGRLVLSVSPGRWGDTEQPAVRKARDPFASLSDLNAIPFRIGEQHELNVAIRHRGQAEIHGFNNDTYDYLNWDNPGFKLESGEYEVAVRLLGRNVDDEFRFLLKGDPAGEGFAEWRSI